MKEDLSHVHVLKSLLLKGVRWGPRLVSAKNQRPLLPGVHSGLLKTYGDTGCSPTRRKRTRGGVGAEEAQ